jgi:ABC-type sugar transport system ATPase subunit
VTKGGGHEVSFDPKVVILDEPTATQIIISHRLTDIFEAGDRIMVLKRGASVGERRISETSAEEVLELIVQGTREAAQGNLSGSGDRAIEHESSISEHHDQALDAWPRRLEQRQQGGFPCARR